MPETDDNKSGYLKILLQGAITVPLVIAVIFILAGRIDYWQGWIFSGSLVLIFLISSLMFADKADLIRERRKPGPGTKWWDKIFYAFYIPAFLALMLIACLDSGRYGWTGPLPAVVYIMGYIIYGFSNFLTVWAMWTNTFFSSTVRIQSDRGQTVVQSGPYRYVRHPGYVGGILMGIGMAVVLGSLWALIPAGVATVLLVIRTFLEDRTLQKELAGYVDYTKNVQYRLLPGIW